MKQGEHRDEAIGTAPATFLDEAIRQPSCLSPRTFQPSLERNRILALAQLDFIDGREVVHLIGQSGTGKSHLAVALGVEAVRVGRSVYFSPLAERAP